MVTVATMVDFFRPRRWPAWALVVLFVGYAAGKAVFAMQGRLGIPRTLMLLALVGMSLAVGAGAAIMVVDGLIGLGVGWRWYHGILGILVLGLLVEAIRSYAVVTRRARA
ncbi:hypothetical protein A8924_5969 [Saccharopolyspora erythraea NRRL 2338]|nr:hypothetical protein A8924_5969 [Saccharopolyspora erythraea NRRL 2338]